MAREWKARPATRPTTITEAARRYHSCALALARSFGLPLTEAFVQTYHPAISSVFIEASRADLRLPAGVQLPPLAAAVASPNGQGALQPEASNRAIGEAIGVSAMTVGRDLAPVTNVTAEPAPMTDAEVST